MSRREVSGAATVATRRAWLALAAAALAALPAPARAFDIQVLLRPFKTPAERFLLDAEDARVRQQFDLAASLLDEAERAEGKTTGPIARERGLLARDRGRLADAAELLKVGADLDYASAARVEQAAVLVQLGRWPEAVEVLGRAFEERGPTLRADDVQVDPRFAPLASFPPFVQLMHTMRDEQSGPIGRLLLKFERIEQSAVEARDVAARLGHWMGVLGRLLAFIFTPVLLLLALSIFLASGFAQTGLIRPPWTLLAGLGLASVLWYFGSRIATMDTSDGRGTIAAAAGIVLAPWLAVAGGRWLLRRRARRAGDPFDTEHLPHTLAMLDEVTRLGRRLAELPPAERGVVQDELQRAELALRDRLRR